MDAAKQAPQTEPLESSQRIILGATSTTKKVSLLSAMSNRHGLITGATGTGKTVSLQLLAENFSRLGVPVFAADVKGDLSGISKAASAHPKIQERIERIGLESYEAENSPTVFWDLYGEKGHPIRTTISEIGPLLFSSMLDLNETQEGVMYIAFQIADDQGLLLIDLKDIRALLSWMADNRAEVKKSYGMVSPNSIAAIQRRLLVLENSGGDKFFGEPAIDIRKFLAKDFSGRGIVNLLDSSKLINSPRLYSNFLLWMLSELFEELEEVGDAELPRLVFFFDEAHLLFDNANEALREKIEQVVRLIRSKGVGIFFVTQHPLDVPDSVLSQLGNRVQHALRAYSPREKKAVDTAASTFRANPNFDVRERITKLGVGEALVSTLDSEGVPHIVEEVLVSPPESQIRPITEAERNGMIESSPLKGVYDEILDRESAFEILEERQKRLAKDESKEKKKSSRRQGVFETFAKSVFRSIGYQIGRQIVRGLLGSITGRA